MCHTYLKACGIEHWTKFLSSWKLTLTQIMSRQTVENMLLKIYNIKNGTWRWNVTRYAVLCKRINKGAFHNIFELKAKEFTIVGHVNVWVKDLIGREICKWIFLACQLNGKWSSRLEQMNKRENERRSDVTGGYTR